jgi:branched-chain amino acid transport system substrate-binding protein
VFRVSHAFPAQGQAAALFAARTLGASTAAILTRPTDEYSAALAAAFAAAFSRQGGQIVHQAHFMANPPALADTLRAIQKSGAAVLYLPVSANAANAVAAALASPALGPPPALIGSDLWESPELNRAALENACFTTAAALPAGQPWVDLYKSTYALDPDPLATLGYQAAQLLLAAVQQTGADNPLTLTRALEQGHSNAFHNPLTPVPVNRISGGQIVPAGTIEINLQPE